MEFSLFYFSSEAAEYAPDKYRLLLESVRYADTHDFTAVWVPERHFHALGGVFPNPAVVASALAMITTRVRLRAGSIVLPLHHPIRAAEDWAVVDNLSNGRVDLSFARGWNANDFVLAPDAYGEARTARLYESIDVVRRLWRGEAVSFRNGKGENVPTRIYPQPRQRELESWLTCSGTAERFEEAGTHGFNILTSLILQPVDDLIQKLATYRDARARAGHDPATGRVTLMLHAFVGDDDAAVRKAVHAPFKEYIRTTVDLWAGSSRRLEEMTADQQSELLEYSFERYYRTSALFGTPASCLPLVQRLAEAGVNEIACLVDFGVATDDVLASLDALDRLRRLANQPAASRNGDGDGNGTADRTALLRELLQRRASVIPVVPPAVPSAPAAATADKTAMLRRLLERHAATHTETHPLSQGQQSLWFLHLQHPESAAYNTAVSLRIRSPLDRAALARACQQLADRHAVLRTTFGDGPEGPIQIVHGYRALALEEVDGSGWEAAALSAQMRAAYARPFDLRNGSVARAHLFRLADDDAVFMLCIHHIARDGWSMTLLLEEWQRLYAAESRGTPIVLPALRSTYTDFVRREAARVAGPEGARLRDHWRGAHAGAPTGAQSFHRPPATTGARGPRRNRHTAFR